MQVDLIDARCLWARSLVQNRATKGENPSLMCSRIKEESSESKQKSHQGHIAEKQNPLEHSHEDVEIINNQRSQMYILVIHSSLQQN